MSKLTLKFKHVITILQYDIIDISLSWIVLRIHYSYDEGEGATLLMMVMLIGSFSSSIVVFPFRLLAAG